MNRGTCRDEQGDLEAALDKSVGIRPASALGQTASTIRLTFRPDHAVGADHPAFHN